MDFTNAFLEAYISYLYTEDGIEYEDYKWIDVHDEWNFSSEVGDIMEERGLEEDDWMLSGTEPKWVWDVLGREKATAENIGLMAEVLDKHDEDVVRAMLKDATSIGNMEGDLWRIHKDEYMYYENLEELCKRFIGGEEAYEALPDVIRGNIDWVGVLEEIEHRTTIYKVRGGGYVELPW